MISLCLASRERPKKFNNMVFSALDNAKNKDNIQFSVFRDLDDSVKYNYPKNHVEIIEKYNGNFSYMHNKCCEQSIGPIYMYSTDDILFLTKDWDKIVEEEFNKYKDGIVSVLPNSDDWKIYNYGSMGFLHDNWIKAVGYMGYSQVWDGIDLWIHELAVRLGRMVRLKNVNIKHDRINDRVYKRKRKNARKRRFLPIYFDPKNILERERCIYKLKERMEVT